MTYRIYFRPWGFVLPDWYPYAEIRIPSNAADYPGQKELSRTEKVRKGGLPPVTRLICWDHSGGKPPFLTCFYSVRGSNSAEFHNQLQIQKQSTLIVLYIHHQPSNVRP